MKSRHRILMWKNITKQKLKEEKTENWKECEEIFNRNVYVRIQNKLSFNDEFCVKNKIICAKLSRIWLINIVYATIQVNTTIPIKTSGGAKFFIIFVLIFVLERIINTESLMIK